MFVKFLFSQSLTIIKKNKDYFKAKSIQLKFGTSEKLFLNHIFNHFLGLNFFFHFLSKILDDMHLTKYMYLIIP